MTLSNKTLGAIAMMAAPFLSLQMLSGQAAGAYNTSLGGVFDLLYILGWMCSIIGLLRLQATGTGKKNGAVLYIQLVLLSIANVWNVWVIINPTANSTLFLILDMFWPLSNVNMLVAGSVIAITGRLKGWRRYVVLVVGLWLPFALGASLLSGRENAASYYPGCVYSTIAWALLGWMIYTSKPQEYQKTQPAL